MPRSLNQSKPIAIPGYSNVGFTSAKSLSRGEDVKHSLNATRQLELADNVHGSNKGGTEVDGKKIPIEGGRPETKKVRRKSNWSSTPKVSGDTVVVENGTNDEIRIDSGRGKRIKKQKKDDQTKITKTKIVKPRSSSNTSKHPKKACKETIPGILDPEGDFEPIIEENTLGAYKEPGLRLMGALPRRRDWTPARDTSREAGRTNGPEAACSALASVGSPLIQSADGGMLKRLREYGFGGPDQAEVSKPYPIPDSSREAATKKRKLDLATGIASTASKAIATKRSRSPKKKPQTITDKATAPFVLDDQAGASTILNYFADPQRSLDPSIAALGQQPEGSNGCNEKHNQSGKAKSSKPKVKKKAKEPPILHPPELAVRVANEQDLLFGSCSQLAREESPTFIRDLQRAVKESEAVDDSQTLPQGQESQSSAQSASSNASKTRLPYAARGLWSVAARDEQGQLLDVDIVDLVDTVDTPQAPRNFSTEPDFVSAEKEESIQPSAAVTAGADEDWTTNVLLKEQGANPLRFDQREAGNPLPRSVAEASARARPKSKSPVKKSANRDPELTAMRCESLADMPNYRGFTDVDLKIAVGKTGFKVMRKREDRISHLEECWHAAQNRKALTSAQNGVEEVTKLSSPAKRRGRPPKDPLASTDVNGAAVTSTLSPKKRLGRPPKDPLASTDVNGAAVTSTLSPKKRLGRPRKGTSASSKISDSNAKAHTAAISLQQTLEIQLVDMAETDHPKITATATRRKMTQNIAPLLVMITNAVKNCPSTHDAQNLTPYEKMLLYDPIVLEDFAQWLNDEGLKRVGCDETVDPMIAKLWCESQSVCCLSRENLKGGTRARC
ncbi:MAG: hypothetical protein Q9221_004464 [Calogaya cf. arnoldii]